MGKTPFLVLYTCSVDDLILAMILDEDGIPTPVSSDNPIPLVVV